MRKLSWPSDKNLRIANRVLLGIIVFCCAYILVLPMLPKLRYEVRKNITKPVKVDVSKPDTIKAIDRSRNHLIIPSMQFDEPVYEGTGIYTINKGLWLRPNTNAPDKGGNTVIAGHRFTYLGSAVFYNLDQLQLNQDVFLVYNGKIYQYKTSKASVVPPTATYIEDPTPGSQLTLYTCTPLVTATNRLVYISTLQEVL